MRRRNSNYGQVLPTHRWRGESRLRGLWNALKWWLGAGVLVAVMWFVIVRDRESPEALLRGPGEHVTARFVRCGQAGSDHCVPDGDTLIMGKRTVRIIGIDAPELHPPRCEAERVKGEAAAAKLLALVNQGTFTLAGPQPAVRDSFDRELRHLLHARGDGSVQSIADDMVASGTARAYLSGARQPWC